ncbi:4-coumarate--CoA ligase-like 9 [Impatiens glandulifera]|uniref:4-coumarate--CoA ligase-like 9 n=1 Tax=Impatiens glandulifera TaxID=253017 RepID=UPI001FB178D8|nr:4-coumarate--CoA ligase-like 9 [Impatiens glandulifera]
MVEMTTAVYPIDRKSGFCSKTTTFHSLRPAVHLPPPSQSISLAEYTFYLLHQTTAGAFTSSSPPETPFLIDSSTDRRLTYSDLLQQTRSLATSIQTLVPSLSNNDVAFILAPPSIHIPILYFALLSIGVTISPANPLATESELAHMIKISKPVIAFATRETSSKLPSFPFGTVLIDSTDFNNMMQSKSNHKSLNREVKINQSDSAAILYSSGTTGRVKGVELSHRNFIAIIAGMYYLRRPRDETENVTNPVSLFPLPLFHVFGFFMLVRAAAMGETLVLMERFDFERMLRFVEKYRVEYMPVSPPLVVALSKSDIVMNYDLSSLKILGCGGAPLGKEVAEKFAVRFPDVEITQGYGLTETSGAATRMIDVEETKQYGSAGMLAENTEAKIVDPGSGEALGPGQSGEIWLRGPTIMKGYIGDKEATVATMDPEGWLKTGDLGYFDENGFLYIVDRLKELIKYKAYQVPPAELEHLLNTHPEIADSAVIPYPDEAAGEIPMAYIVRKQGSSISEGQIMEYIAKQVSPYKKIRKVAFTAAIPKSPTGKILRRELVNHAVSAVSSRL